MSDPETRVLRIIHGLTNNIMDFEVPPEFDLGTQIKVWQSDGFINTGKYFVAWQWVQHAALLTQDEIARLQPPPGAQVNQGTLN